ncbi:MAG: membrane-bound lytic murein transglycosylase MltF [Ferrovum sp.]|nr:membrane-bound lytic murein transglycosylase MltF [Ferrovum sp.]NDU87673.1 membrane-bound lytic murein transglycosylase MltF [Ferrovum sp.]
MVPQPKVMTLGHWMLDYFRRRPERLLLMILVVSGLIVWGRDYFYPRDRGAQALEWAPILPPVTNLAALPELVVATRRGPATYWTEPDGRTLGIEHDLALSFGLSLGKPVRFLVLDNLNQVMVAVHQGKAHFAAAAVPVTTDFGRDFQFTPPYYHSHPQVVFNPLLHRSVHSPAELSGQTVTLVPNPDLVARLNHLQEKTQGFSWKAAPHGMTEMELMRQVYEGQVSYGAASSDIIAVAQNYYPDLSVAFNLGSDLPLAWAFPISSPLLYEAALHFMQSYQRSNGLAQVVEHYYGSVGALSHDDALDFLQKRVYRLPTLMPIFRNAAALSGVDWRLLAAMAFQESRWNNDAISPTGVRGLMMLTADTADRLGVSDRLDAAQAVPAAARYLARLRDELPLAISEPDRTWIALAAYNVGSAHVEDALFLARRRGFDVNGWNSLRQTLPLLTDPDIYRQVRHGFARGGEPVRFVENVRSYYDILEHFERDTPVPNVKKLGR